MSEPRRDHWGRYMLRPPSGGKPVAHTRATTVAETLDDRYNLEKWQQRHVALGIAARDDLYALACSHTADDKGPLNKLCEQAIEASKASSRANVGTALHRLTERLDAGEQFEVPDLWRADTDAYLAACEAHGIQTDPTMIERIAVIEGESEPVAGTLDRVVTWGGRRFIGDLKTGRDLSWSWRAIAVQLALYAHGASLYNPETDEHEAMPEVDQERALVFHLPAGEGRCDVYTVDLVAGWEAAQQSLAVRAWRKRRDLATPLSNQIELAA